MMTNDSFIKYSSDFSPIEGDGSLENPYQIAHPFHFRWMRRNLSSHFKLTRDLDLEENENFKPIGSEKKPFEGTFDGAGKIIQNLKIQRPDRDRVGLFGVTGKNSVIRNVRLIEVDIQGNCGVGALVGNNFGTIEESYATGKVEGEGNTVGGLVGWNDGMVESSYAKVEVKGEENVGGFIGRNSGTIEESYYAVKKVEGKEAVGGLVGRNSGTIEESYSYAEGKVEGEGNTVGGLVGWNSQKGRIEGKNYWLTGSAKQGIGTNDGKVSHIQGKSDTNDGKFSHIQGKSEIRELLSKGLGWNFEVWILNDEENLHPQLRWQSLQ